MLTRPIKVVKNYLPHAEGSCLFSMGGTSVLCVATVEDRIPPFIEKKGLEHGWVTAEYAMLPRSGRERTPRGKAANSGRSQEISRLVGRSLRGVVDLDALGRRTIVIDCDVIKADGGTRTASINGGFIALAIALKKLHRNGVLATVPLKDSCAAVSVGIVKKKMIVDLCAAEDNGADVDFNVVMNSSGGLLEVQGTAEGDAFTRRQLNAMLDKASAAIASILKIQKKYIS